MHIDDIVAELNTRFAITPAQLPAFLDRFGKTRTAACAFRCSGHNLPQHKKMR